MEHSANTSLEQQDAFYDTNFKELKLAEATLNHKTFENCQFSHCDFSEAVLSQCKFVECEFISCNFSAADFHQTALVDVTFIESKLLGINWTRVKWPYVALASPIKFYLCNISNSNFYELELAEIVIEECKAHEVDFRECDLSSGSLVQTDFQGSLFMHTKLVSADFTDAINYAIDPLQNQIRKATFSMPDAMNLLQGFEINIAQLK